MAESGLTVHEIKLERILASAIEVFYERGFRDGTTKDVAERVGLTQPAIYHYIGSKSDLLSTLVRRLGQTLAEAVERGATAPGGPEDRVRGILDEYAHAVLANRKACAVYWDERKHIEPDVMAELVSIQRNLLRRLMGYISEAQKAGNLAPGHDPRIVAESIFALGSWPYRWYQPGHGTEPEDITSALHDLLGLPQG